MRPILTPDVRKRFFAKFVRRRGRCWIWRGALNSAGYGVVSIAGKRWLATHVSLEIAGKSRTPERRCALHSLECKSKACVNPDHLRWGTHAENMADASLLGLLCVPRPNWKKKTLTDRDVAHIRFSREPGAQIARRLGVSKGYVNNIRSGRIAWGRVC